MNVTEPFVLKRDVLLIPCAELSDDVRRRIDYRDGDFTLSQQHGRMLAQVIDGATAALLSLFREPRTIVDAVIENSRALGLDAEERFDEMLPHLGVFVEKRVLVPAGSDDDDELRPRFDSGSDFAGWTIVRCASLIDDSEIYQLHRGGDVAALKIARKAGALHDAFANEAAILRRLDGSGIAPRLLDAGAHEERPYLILEWIDGADATVAAAQRRHDRAALATLCASIAAAYAALHARGVLHADVHPRNVLAGDGGITLLDFGAARLLDEPPRGGRSAIHYYLEPEYFADGGGAPTPAGEQFALAALLYFAIVGQHYADFRYDRAEMDRQIASEPPLPFAQRGLAPWPDVETVLFRALEKVPARRFPSVAEMAERLAEARDRAVAEALDAPLGDAAHALLDETLRSFARGGAMFAGGYPEPTASINNGCAGAAVGLLRIAEARSDAKLLALAEVWSSRAIARIGTVGAYWNSDSLSRDILGDVTPYHTDSGIHAAAAAIAHARGDRGAQAHAIAAFLEASKRPCDNLDLTLGRSGTLLACAMLLDLRDDAALRAFGGDTMHAIWDALPPIDRPGAYLGMAHGWAGFLYAALRWCAASGDALPPRFRERLDDFATMPFLRIKVESPQHETLTSWCNGSAGTLFLFTLAYKFFGDARWLELAERCARDSWEQRCTSNTLCCGSAGRAYALLNFYRHTGAAEWLSRARQLANHAASVSTPNKSLWKGDLGAAVLIADLASPENARMPFFE